MIPATFLDRSHQSCRLVLLHWREDDFTYEAHLLDPSGMVWFGYNADPNSAIIDAAHHRCGSARSKPARTSRSATVVSTILDRLLNRPAQTINRRI